MKKIEIIINPQHWDPTRAVLDSLHLQAVLRQVKTFGRKPTRQEVFRGLRYTVDTAAELEVTLVIRDELLEQTLRTLIPAIGDAELLVTSVERPTTDHALTSPRSKPSTVRAAPPPVNAAAPAPTRTLVRA